MPTILVNDVELYYKWHGAEDAPALVFVNGLTASTESWIFQTPAFAERLRVLLYDCRGQGQSAKPAGPYATKQHAADLLALLDALDLGTVYIVGLSNGGAVAMHLAADNPQRVRRLVLSSTHARADTLMRSKLQSWLTALDAGGPLMRFDAATPWVWGRRFLDENEDVLATLRNQAAQATPNAVRALITGAMGHDVTDHLADISVPTLVMVGEEDVLTPPWYARDVAAGIPGAELVVVPNAGHALPIERPNVFNALALAFLGTETPQRHQKLEKTS